MPQTRDHFLFFIFIFLKAKYRPALPISLPFPTNSRQLFPLASGSPASSVEAAAATPGLGVFKVSSPAGVRVWGLRSSFDVNPPAAASW